MIMTICPVQGSRMLHTTAALLGRRGGQRWRGTRNAQKGSIRLMPHQQRGLTEGEVASFLPYPAMASTSRLAYLLKAVEAVLKTR